MIVVVSLLAGLLTALALVAGPFSGGPENEITGAILLGFAFGWTLLALLSTRFTDRPQRWAAVPAAAMGIAGAGLLLLAPGPGSSASSRSPRWAAASTSCAARPKAPRPRSRDSD